MCFDVLTWDWDSTRTEISVFVVAGSVGGAECQQVRGRRPNVVGQHSADSVSLEGTGVVSGLAQLLHRYSTVTATVIE